jgi:hypothetical protein
MAWKTCAPFWPRSAHGYVRALGQTDVVTDLSFYASALDLLAVRVGGLKVHAAGQIFSVRMSVKVAKTSSTKITTIMALRSPGCSSVHKCVIGQLVFVSPRGVRFDHHRDAQRPGLNVSTVFQFSRLYDCLPLPMDNRAAMTCLGYSGSHSKLCAGSYNSASNCLVLDEHCSGHLQIGVIWILFPSPCQFPTI